MNTSFLIKNISRLVTMSDVVKKGGALGVIEDAAIRVRAGRIVWIGKNDKIPKIHSFEEDVDATGCVVMPGLIDAHTHLVHGGWRYGEFNLRSQGKTYKEIAKEGGGIMSTVKATCLAKKEDLYAFALERLRESFDLGVTTIEIKSGYGLELNAEMKMLYVIDGLSRAGFQKVVGTFLGAHVVPREYKKNRGEYTKLLIEKMIPESTTFGVVRACDCFVDDGAFTSEEARLICKAAASFGMKLHLHVDQFGDNRGGGLAAELGVLSADHLDYVSDDGILAMKKAEVVGVVLPGASFFAGKGHFPNARKMIDMGLDVAIATDYNPGTNPSLNLWDAATIAITQMGMSCDEALTAITKNAAKALGLEDAGDLSIGKRADIIILDAPHEHFPLYRYGKNFVKRVFVGQ